MGKSTAAEGAAKALKKDQSHKHAAAKPQEKTTNPEFMDNKGAVEDLNLAGPCNVWSNLIYNGSIWKSFKRLRKLELNSNELTTLPSSLEAISSSLEILFLSENKFSAIPEVVGKLNNLRMISLRGNCLTELSSTNLPSSLVWLILTNNNITRIDPNVNKLKGLKKLMLSHNKLTEVPSELGDCKDLELVRLASNAINTSLPHKFLTLPKLAWISLGGNPISEIPSHKMKFIERSSISFDKSNVLGKGASGTVYKGVFEGEDVAVKVFKQGSKGSDGKPEDEAVINSIIDHHFTVSSRGVFRSSDDDDVIEGMVMELLENAVSLLYLLRFRFVLCNTYALKTATSRTLVQTAIGKPPSFSTCTRDAGPEEDVKSLDKGRILSIITNMVNALAYIHSVKVMNGDVYLHNTLRCVKNGEAMTRLSDWGASFVYNNNMVASFSDNSSRVFEKIEVLAFGRLIQDLFMWYCGVACPDSTETYNYPEKTSIDVGPFKDLMASILQPDQSKRPTFEEIKEKLTVIPEFQNHM